MTTTRPADLDRFRRVVTEQLGLQFDDAKLPLLDEILSRRLDACGLSSSVYLTNLESRRSAAEPRALARELTVGETYFFRNIDQFLAFAQVVLPERMAAQGARRQLRILSAGCATGEEAFSLAIVARSAIPDVAWNVSVRAVDINPDALEKAASGRFTKWALRETPPEIQRDYFRQEGGLVVLDEEIRRAVTFDEWNLTVDDAELWQPGAYDVVFCRNVLMYFAPAHARALVERITRALAPGGFLFLGHAETLRGLSQGFHLCHSHGTFYYQNKEGADVPRSWSWSPAPRSAFSQPTAAFAPVDAADNWVSAIHRAAERVQALSARTAAAAATPAREEPRSRPHINAALDLFKQERFSEALDVIHRSFPDSENDPDVLLLHALLLAHSRRLAAAERACRRLLAVDELNAGAHYVLALCREGAGDPDGATEHDQTAAYLDPLFAMPRLHLGLLARRAGNRDTARGELGRALLLLEREDAARIVFFGGGFSREALIALCRAEFTACGDRS